MPEGRVAGSGRHRVAGIAAAIGPGVASQLGWLGRAEEMARAFPPRCAYVFFYITGRVWALNSSQEM
jgi:hypothetical protein